MPINPLFLAKGMGVPYSPPKCTICGNMATALAKNKEPRCTRHQREEPKARVCSRCGAPMAVRENKKNHNYFWGCTAFPNCTETHPM
jgi:DNA-directed RNA polymerase subunit RPC12/RpoP